MALSAAKIMMDGYQEVANIWMHSSDLGPIAGPIVGAVQTAAAVIRTVSALSDLNSIPGYAAGRTGSGMAISPSTGQAVSPWGALLEYSGMSVSSSGKLTDDSGFAVAGVVHEDEYVIPKWLRQDPQVAAFEEWVEAKRLRGFYEGGRTSSERVPVGAGVVGLGVSDAGTTAVLEQLAGVLQSLDGRLANVETWQSRLQVVFDVQGHRKLTEEQRQVEYDSAIRKSPK
jgi:hypothetical protein